MLHDVRQVWSLFGLLVLSALLRPLSRLWPKDPRLVAFMPREGTRYIDNVAHFHANLQRLGLLPPEAYLLVTSPRVAKRWRGRGQNVRLYRPYSWRDLLLYLRTAVVIVDSWQWVHGGRYSVFRGAKKVQLWHGIPLKKIERSNLGGPRRRGFLGLMRRVRDWTIGRYPAYDIAVSTSDFFTTNAFARAFVAKKYPTTGYPRNDCLFETPGKEAAVDSDQFTLRAARHLQAKGKRVIVYAPTFRDTGGGPFEDYALDLMALYEFAQEHDLVFVVKLHPYVAEPPPSYLWPHVMVYDSSKDAGPLLQCADLLVTDYSSIYFDFLLVDRPVVFFPYDFEKYYKYDRTFLFDYDEYTPGPKCFDQTSFFATILAELDSPNPDWQKKRAALRDKSFTHVDGGATVRLWREIEALTRTSRGEEGPRAT